MKGLEALREASWFLAGEGKVHDTFRRITHRLREAKIAYVTIGGMAFFAHGYRRYTDEIEILVTPAGLDAIHKGLVDEFERVTGRDKALRDIQTGVMIKFATAGEYPGRQKSVSFPDPATASVQIGATQVITIEKLIELKLASGLTNTQRMRDLSDVRDLIAHLNLPLELAEKLDPSVRDTYIEYWHDYQNSPPPDRE